MLCRKGLSAGTFNRSPKSFTGESLHTTQPKVQHQVHIAAKQRKQARQGLAFSPAASETLQLSAAVVDPACPDTKECTASIQPSASNIAEVLGQVLICECKTLQPETHYEAALQTLKAAVQSLEQQYRHYYSGVVRLEVPLPRGITALHWLQGQGQTEQARIYFSPRQSSAPGTQGAAAAEAATAGAGPVAGLGAAWLWQGAAGEPLSPQAVQEMANFLSTAHPRLRVLGGSRFNTSQTPATEWAEFGSYCFMLPRMEMLEAAGCSLLSCNVAWHAEVLNQQHNGIDSAQHAGSSSIHDAIASTLEALDALQSPSAAAAAAFQVTRESVQHLPDEEGWASLMEPLHDSLATSQVSTDRLPQLHQVEAGVAKTEYEMNGQGGLDQLLAALDGGFQGLGQPAPETGLTKIVLARRSDVKFRGSLDPFALLQALQERDPRSYQILMQQPSGACFLGSTPEQLYIRTESAVASEAVAATRPRGPPGDIEKDFWYAFDLLRSPKDHVEFTLVRDFVRDALAEVCSEVRVDTEKSVLKQAAVQHLYGRLSGQLQPHTNDAQLLAALHPTPAVCGRPRSEAKAVLAENEPFDRGYYAGPFGWISGSAAEFVVAIRSALMQDLPEHQSTTPLSQSDSLPSVDKLAAATDSSEADVQQHDISGLDGANTSNSSRDVPPTTNGNASSHLRASSETFGVRQQQSSRKPSTAQPAAEAHTISLYAGVGIVKGSTASSEWQELELKARQFQMLLQPLPSLADAPNVNALWAGALVEELCRHGIHTFGVAPGSRSSALTLAVAMHPRARITTCIDERSLGFWALGHASATGRPAAVITSSGTAVANLLPAVVEACQSQVAMLLLTADRPSELRDTGANQTIDQVKIFGGYVRWAVDVPPPDHVMPLRSLLTSVDTAVRFATDLPAGPVHMNCQFREPLAPAVANWPSSLLQGTHQWLRSAAPFTSAITPLTSNASVLPSAHASLMSQLGSAQRGLLVVAHLASHQDVVAALKIAQALRWPVVADALSGLRVGMSEASAEQLTVVHQFDQVLLDKASWPALKPDVVLQLGSHLVSKRTLNFLEWSALDEEDLSPLVWMHADSSSKRMDEKHLISQRIQLPLPQLAHMLSQGLAGVRPGQQALQYRQLVGALNDVAHHEVDTWLTEQTDMTEPYVARCLSQMLPSGNGLFIGNSMPIRDMDMYAAWQHIRRQQGYIAAGSSSPVGSNRGASGIDGVLSTAAGFAAGLKRPVTLVVGDVSFLHDINGLNLLRTGDLQPAVTVVLINNGGGGIFSFLPIAGSLLPEVFTPLWATPQNVDLAGMCRAQGIAHQKVTAVQELAGALHAAWALKRHSVLEVITARDSNVDQHRQLQAAVQQAVRQAATLLMPAAPGVSAAAAHLEPMPILSARWQRYSLPLKKPLTTGAGRADREGLLLRLTLQAGERLVIGVGEIAPLPGLHKESILKAEQQLVLVCELLQGVDVPCSLLLMQGRISAWIKDTLGLDPANLYPSVRCGLEGAVLTAMADAHGMPLAGALRSVHRFDHQPVKATRTAVLVNGLLDCNGSVEEAVTEARRLVAQGYAALKIKAAEIGRHTGQLAVQVARRSSPLDDAALVLGVRRALGPAAILRADANRRWSLQQAVAFGTAAAAADLQYIEEPVQDTADLADFYAQTHMSLALDETLDEGLPLGSAAGLGSKVQQVVSMLPFGAVAALVVKPGAVGGFERTHALAKAAAKQNIQVIVSSAFESSIGLAQYACLAGLLDQLFHASKPASWQQQVAHGLATEGWFLPASPTPLLQPLCTCLPSASSANVRPAKGKAVAVAVAAEVRSPTSISLQTASDLLATVHTSQALDLQHIVGLDRQYATFEESACRIQTASSQYTFRVLTCCGQDSSSQTQTHRSAHISLQPDIQGSRQGFNSCAASNKQQRPAVLFLHGFMGSADDWRPLMQALSATHHCVAVDLPGHGQTRLTGEEGYEFEQTADAVAEVVRQLGLRGCSLVGYSMGARLALRLACSQPALFKTVVSISGSPGLADERMAAARLERDASLATALESSGIHAFAQSWYEQPMWSSLKQHPRFKSMVQQRCRFGHADLLAKSLVGMSVGRQLFLGPYLPDAAMHCKLVLVSGSEDAKFVKIAEHLASRVRQLRQTSDSPPTTQQQLQWDSAADSQPPMSPRYIEPITNVVVQQCGHAVHVERPEAILRILSLA